MYIYQISLLIFGIVSSLIGLDSFIPCAFKLQFPCCNWNSNQRIVSLTSLLNFFCSSSADITNEIKQNCNHI